MVLSEEEKFKTLLLR
jgi:hypothetical protein